MEFVHFGLVNHVPFVGRGFSPLASFTGFQKPFGFILRFDISLRRWSRNSFLLLKDVEYLGDLVCLALRMVLLEKGVVVRVGSRYRSKSELGELGILRLFRSAVTIDVLPVGAAFG